MSYNSNNRKIKANDTRQKIYESAEKLFASHDYDNISVDAIVRSAGVSKGSFYVHFASKDALITELINVHVTKADTNYKKFLDSCSNDVPAKDMLLLLIERIADVLIEKIGRDRMRMVYKAQITNDFYTNAVTSYNRDLYILFGFVLERGLSRKEFKSDISLDALTKHFLMAIRGVTYEWCIRTPEFDYKAQALEHFKLMLDALQ